MYNFRSRGQPQPVAPFVGQERGITWYWVAGLDIQIPHPQGQGAPLNIAPHPVPARTSFLLAPGTGQSGTYR